ncbi:MAG: hypothetical protein ABJM29_18690 [Rhizobiaceae bacterium]
MNEGAAERRAATASYMEDMLGELAQLGRHMKCDFLVFLLEMAQLEAGNVKDNNPTPGRQRDSLDAEDAMTAEELAAIFVRKNSSEH